MSEGSDPSPRAGERVHVAAGAPDPRRWLALAAALTAPFLGVVDFFIVNLALPQIHERLGASFAQQELVIALYGLAYAVFVVTGGRLGDTHGRKRVFLLGLLGFVIASILCGLAPSPLFLLCARFFQGFTAALAFPQVLALIQVTFPEHERPRALAYFGLTVGLASIAGQLLGGHLIEWNPFDLSGSFLAKTEIDFAVYASINRLKNDKLAEIWVNVSVTKTEARPLGCRLSTRPSQAATLTVALTPSTVERETTGFSPALATTTSMAAKVRTLSKAATASTGCLGAPAKMSSSEMCRRRA
jgi:MFS family permease